MKNILKHLPRGIVKNNSIIIERGKGCWVWDKQGKKYLDMTSGIGSLSTGHCHPYIVDKVKSQLDNLILGQQNCFLSHIEQEKFVDKLLNIVPKNHTNFLFTNSGSECTDNAIKIARMSTGKSNIICINGGFHGRTLCGMSLSSSKSSYRHGFQPLIPGIFFCNGFDKNNLKMILDMQTSPEETCAIIMEPILGEGGIIEIPKDFACYVEKICNEHNIKLIIDEVQSGSGRTGNWWAHENLNIIPDIMTIAKGIGSGFPIGIVSSSKDIFDKMTNNSLGGTYGGNCIATTAASATIDVILNEGLKDNSKKMGEIIKKDLSTMPYIKNVRQYGLFIAADLNDDIKVSSIINDAIKNDLILLSCGKNSLRIIPPLIINENEIEIFNEKLFKTLFNY